MPLSSKKQYLQLGAPAEHAEGQLSPGRIEPMLLWPGRGNFSFRVFFFFFFSLVYFFIFLSFCASWNILLYPYMHELFWHYQTNQSSGSGFSVNLFESIWTPHIPAYPPASQSMSPSSSALFIRRTAYEHSPLLHQQRAWLRHCWQQGVKAGHVVLT